MNMFIRSHSDEIEAEKAKAIVRAAKVVASDETGVRIEGTNSYHWVFHLKDAVVRRPDCCRAARIVDGMMDGHVPESVDFRPLLGPAEPWRAASNLSCSSGPRHRIRVRARLR